MQMTDVALLELIDRIEDILQFQDKIGTPASVRRIWKILREDLRHLIRIDGSALFLADESSHEFLLKYASTTGSELTLQRETDAQIETGMFSWVLNRRYPVPVTPLVLDKSSTLLMLPLATRKSKLGMVLATTRQDTGAFTGEALKLLTILTQQCSLALEKALSYENLKKHHELLEKSHHEIWNLSRTDPLTGSYNRGYLAERLPQEIKRARRYQRHLSIVLCDIDFFKAINDRYGHPVGDEVLKEFVRRLAGMIRQDIDWLARYGGEEFLLVLPETPLQGALQLAERLRTCIGEPVFSAGTNELCISASFGVTSMPLSCGNQTVNVTPEGMIRSADRYLYRAKASGRDRVEGGLMPV